MTKRLLIILTLVGLILLIPLTAMQLSNEVQWTGSDFLVAALLLFATALVINQVLLNITSTKKRLLFIGLIVLILILLWAELAVGIFE